IHRSRGGVERIAGRPGTDAERARVLQMVLVAQRHAGPERLAGEKVPERARLKAGLAFTSADAELLERLGRQPGSDHRARRERAAYVQAVLGDAIVLALLTEPHELERRHCIADPAPPEGADRVGEV